ncbi:AAA family ATPase [Xenophilus sp. Marseille-Q4582]|uniref:AAA family ATPase n=1 Tax=Xenophilus sp. Marseille-Q4582 TaxID=2866600 RepID=UPI001CE3DBC3|nr:AAA family ATPase [Xenophilus sp. Marseille-Q4582]
MKLVFIHGPVASGKLTVARELGRMTGYAVFHNHLVVDAVAAVFPFGSEPFVRLREKIWLDMMSEAALAGRSLIFTFAPESTVTEGFPARVAQSVGRAGGMTHFVKLTVPAAEQEKRLTAPSRSEFGKLQSVDLLRELRSMFEAAERAMPVGDVEIDTSTHAPADAARAIVKALGLPVLSPVGPPGRG